MFRPLGFFRSLPVILLVSALLLAAFLQGELLLGSGLLAEARVLAYRLAFWAVLPLRSLIEACLPTVQHHSTPLHYGLLAGALPFYVGGLWWSGRRVGGRLYRRLAAPLAPPARRVAQAQLGETEELNFGRRPFLLRAAAGTVGLAGGSLGGYIAVIEPEHLRIRHYTLLIRDLPGELSGLRLIHLSDTHYGPFVPMSYLEEAVERANRLRGDLIVLTGDYVHKTPRSVQPGIGVLGGLRARLGVAAVLGNHDHWEGTGRCHDAFRQIGLPLIDNDRLFLTPTGLASRPDPGRSLCLAGVGDLWTDEVRLDRALDGVAESMPRILLSHNPDVAERIEPGRRVDVMLSGHTHGGQVRLPLLGSPYRVTKMGEKYLGGLCQGPHCAVIVSRGVGLSGVPLRLGVPPEIGVITLLRG